MISSLYNKFFAKETESSDEQPVRSLSDTQQDSKRERRNIKGKITHLNDGHGFVNNNIHFEFDSVLGGPDNLKLGNKVEVLAYRKHSVGGWRAVTVTPTPDGIAADDGWVEDIVIEDDERDRELVEQPRLAQSQEMTLAIPENTELYKDKENMKVTDDLATPEMEMGQSANVIMWIRNLDKSQSRTLKNCSVVKGEQDSHVSVLSITKQCHVTNLCDVTTFPECEVTYDAPVKVVLHCKACILGQTSETVLLDFGGFKIGRLVSVCTFDPIAMSLAPSQPYVVPEKNFWNVPSSNSGQYTIVPGQKPDWGSKRNTGSSLPVRLLPFDYTRPLDDCISQGREPRDIMPCLGQLLTINNYVKRFNALLHIESIQGKNDLVKFALHRVCFQPQGLYLSLAVPGLSEGRPSLLSGDKVRASSPVVGGSAPAFEGYIHEIRQKSILLKFHENFHTTYGGEDYNVEFTANRLIARRMHNAVKMGVSLGDQVLFPKYYTPKLGQTRKDNTPHECTVEEIDWYNNMLNSEQRAAVCSVLNGVARPTPYILFGPPGTGKTVTLVETVLQLFFKVPTSRILLTAPSNSAADLLAQRLVDSGQLKTTDMIRLNAYSRSYVVCRGGGYVRVMSDSLDPFTCNPDDLDEVLSYRLLVTTCITAGTLYSHRRCLGAYTHIIVDEAGQATEPEVLIPISLATRSTSQVVLAGDPLQLGAVLTSKHSQRYGLDISLLERLTLLPLYSRDEQKYAQFGNYNPHLVTKLVQNYRCHPVLLEVPSRLFYHGELVVKGRGDVTHAMVDFDKLPNKYDCPIIFHGLRSKDLRENDSPSWFNANEALQVIYYLKDLTHQTKYTLNMEDIGIITPYRKQVEKIRKLIKSFGMESVKVGSVEEFQGQERLVIIISTVRSTEAEISKDIRHHLGFLSNPKRFNVAITRAQALLIVIGNPHVLSKDRHWRELLCYCVENNAYTGCDLPEDIDACVTRLNPMTDSEIRAKKDEELRREEEMKNPIPDQNGQSDVKNTPQSDGQSTDISHLESSTTTLTSADLTSAEPKLNVTQDAGSQLFDSDDGLDDIMAELDSETDEVMVELAEKMDAMEVADASITEHCDEEEWNDLPQEIDASELPQWSNANFADNIGSDTDSEDDYFVTKQQNRLQQKAEKRAEKQTTAVQENAPFDKNCLSGLASAGFGEFRGNVQPIPFSTAFIGKQMDDSDFSSDVDSIHSDVDQLAFQCMEQMNNPDVIPDKDDEESWQNEIKTREAREGEEMGEVIKLPDDFDFQKELWTEEISDSELLGDGNEYMNGLLTDQMNNLNDVNEDFDLDVVVEDGCSDLEDANSDIDSSVKSYSSGEVDVLVEEDSCDGDESDAADDEDEEFSGLVEKWNNHDGKVGKQMGQDVGSLDVNRLTELDENHDSDALPELKTQTVIEDSSTIESDVCLAVGTEMSDAEQEQYDNGLKGRVTETFGMVRHEQACTKWSFSDFKPDNSDNSSDIASICDDVEKASYLCLNSMVNEDMLTDEEDTKSWQKEIKYREAREGEEMGETIQHTGDDMNNYITSEWEKLDTEGEETSPCTDTKLTLDDSSTKPAKNKDIEEDYWNSSEQHNNNMDKMTVCLNSNSEVDSSEGKQLSVVDVADCWDNASCQQSNTDNKKNVSLECSETVADIIQYCSEQNMGNNKTDKSEPCVNTTSCLESIKAHESSRDCKTKFEQDYWNSPSNENYSVSSTSVAVSTNSATVAVSSSNTSAAVNSCRSPITNPPISSTAVSTAVSTTVSTTPIVSALSYSPAVRNESSSPGNGASATSAYKHSGKIQQKSSPYGKSSNKISFLDKKIIRQLEYYFGTMNLHQDKFMQEEMEANNGKIAMTTLMKFNKLRQLTENIDVITRAIFKAKSDVLQLTNDRQWVHRPDYNPLPTDLTEWKKQLTKRTVLIEGLQSRFRMNDLTNFIERRFGKTEHMKILREGYDCAQVQALIVFYSITDAKRFVNDNNTMFDQSLLVKSFRDDSTEVLLGKSRQPYPTQPILTPDDIEDFIEESTNFVPKQNGDSIPNSKFTENQKNTIEENKRKARERLAQKRLSTNQSSPSIDSTVLPANDSSVSNQSNLLDTSRSSIESDSVSLREQSPSKMTAEQQQKMEENRQRAQKRLAANKAKQKNTSDSESICLQGDLSPQQKTAMEASKAKAKKRLAETKQKRRVLRYGGHLLPKDRPENAKCRDLFPAAPKWTKSLPKSQSCDTCLGANSDELLTLSSLTKSSTIDTLSCVVDQDVPKEGHDSDPEGDDYNPLGWLPVDCVQGDSDVLIESSSDDGN